MICSCGQVCDLFSGRGRRGLERGARRPVSRVLSPPFGEGRPFLCDARRRAPDATNPGGEARNPWHHANDAGRPYSVLLPVGFTLPPLLPRARCALAAPFHPCPRPMVAHARPAVCFLWHFPWGHPRRPLAGTVFPWSPDFPPGLPPAVVQPSDETGGSHERVKRQGNSIYDVTKLTFGNSAVDAMPLVPAS